MSIPNREEGESSSGHRVSGLGTRRSGIGAALLVAIAIGCAGTGSGEKSKPSASGAPSDGAPSAVATAQPKSHRVLFIGTSLTAGLGLDPDSAYPQLIQRKIDSAGLHYEVVNAGESGETSAGLLRRLDWLMKGDFAVAVLETGANDGLRGLDVGQTERNIQAAIDGITRAHPAARLVLVQMEAPPNMGTAYTTAFHAMFPRLAKKNGLQLLPFLLDSVAGRASLNQADGIHPNMTGERIVASNVWRGLGPTLRDVEAHLRQQGE